jgi:Cft2 family RNA processing exonuclease
LKLSFHGADRSVTGSCHLVECAGKRILIDCGLHQGSRELDEENSGPFGFDAAGINYVLLTHAHLDHCGRLPLLAKRGFRGEIIDVVDRLPQMSAKGAHLKQQLQDKLIEHKHYIRKHGEDMPEIRNWQWSAKK